MVGLCRSRSFRQRAVAPKVSRSKIIVQNRHSERTAGIGIVLGLRLGETVVLSVSEQTNPYRCQLCAYIRQVCPEAFNSIIGY
jgi:hypothetical protein